MGFLALKMTKESAAFIATFEKMYKVLTRKMLLIDLTYGDARHPSSLLLKAILLDLRSDCWLWLEACLLGERAALLLLWERRLRSLLWSKTGKPLQLLWGQALSLGLLWGKTLLLLCSKALLLLLSKALLWCEALLLLLWYEALLISLLSESLDKDM